MKSAWFGARRTAAQTITAAAGSPLVPDVERVVPAIEDLQVVAVDRPAYRDGAEPMRTEVLRILRSNVDATDDGCHPVWHQLGVHAPVGNARSVTP